MSARPLFLGLCRTFSDCESWCSLWYLQPFERRSFQFNDWKFPVKLTTFLSSEESITPKPAKCHGAARRQWLLGLFPMESERCIPAVTCLTDSSDEINSEVDKQEWLPKMKRARRVRRVRKDRRPRKKRLKVNDSVHVQCTLSKGCIRGCRESFRSKEGLKKLVEFRNQWAALHKTDQDAVDLWWSFRNLSLC